MTEDLFELEVEPRRFEFRSSWVMAYVLKFSRDHKHSLNSTQAQSILYCCYGAVLAKFNERLVDEHPRAWMYGPVFPRTTNDIKKQRLTEDMVKQFESVCPRPMLNLVDLTIATFWRYSAYEMSSWTRMKDGPWHKTEPLAVIDDREIAQWFSEYLPIIEKQGSEALEIAQPPTQEGGK